MWFGVEIQCFEGWPAECEDFKVLLSEGERVLVNEFKGGQVRA